MKSTVSLRRAGKFWRAVEREHAFGDKAIRHRLHKLYCIKYRSKMSPGGR